ncbi:hypothetical protein ACFQ2Y_39865 [Streptomyces malaysiensis subsp. malaysiensis]
MYGGRGRAVHEGDGGRQGALAQDEAVVRGEHDLVLVGGRAVGAAGGADGLGDIGGIGGVFGIGVEEFTDQTGGVRGRVVAPAQAQAAPAQIGFLVGQAACHAPRGGVGGMGDRPGGRLGAVRPGDQPQADRGR